jgi:YidC/Oxa1 family membrane protein insertase
MLAVDSLAAGADARGRAPKVTHWETKLPAIFTGGRGGGCGGAPAADLLPETAGKQVDGAQEWIALKSRFFVQTFSSSATNSGFRIDLARVPGAGPLRLDHVGAQILFDGAELAPGAALERSHMLYIGPKKLSLLRRLGHRTAEIMQFGTFKWMCVLLVPTLNFFYDLIPNYGVAIILLTLLVRVIFWPLTHKSTEGMKRMQALQPKLNELKEQFKGDPQKLQQETWKIYRENKVNPMSSCLPMLVQIPVFIALFTVLRSAVELRYAPFLWIADLSEPENLLKGVLPVIPALNILPFFMAGTMILQSKLTPSMGDPAQQKMMMWMMPAMMLFMFYSMPSALVLYWTVSQILAIVQLAWQKRKGAAAGAGPAAPAGLTPDTGLTRQARRRLAR